LGAIKVPIFDPVPHIGQERLRLLELLSHLLEDSLVQTGERTNLPLRSVALSEAEKRELANLLGSLLEDRSFYLALSFVDGILNLNGLRDEQLREIYLSERKKRGRTRVLSSKLWADFLARIGRRSGWTTWGSSAHPMDYSHFLKMEERLLNALKFPRSVIREAVQLISRLQTSVEQVLLKSAQAKAAVEDTTHDLLIRLRETLRSRSVQELSKSQVIGLAIVVANTSVLFTTRDWSAAGTMSAISGGLVQTVSVD
jgi:hypothetical protein